MNKRAYISVLSIFFFINYGLGQIKLPPPIISGGAVAMLPDSSLLVGGSTPDFETIRYVYTGQSWISEPNELSDLLNGILYSGCHLHFRFSNDFSRFIVMLHGSVDQRIYLTEKKEGHWTLFRDVIDPSEYSYFNNTPSFNYDNTKLYLSDNSKPENTLYTYTNTQSFTESTQYLLKDFSLVQNVIGIGNQSVLVNGQRNKFDRKKRGAKEQVAWYFLKQLQDGQWSVPYKVSELDGEFYKFQLSITPFDEVMLFSNWETGDVYLVETPLIIRQELEKARQSQVNVNNPTSVSKRDFIENNNPINKIVKPTGKYYALLIGNSDYLLDDLDLNNPTNDARELSDLLSRKYQFNQENIITLFNADRESILEELYSLRSTITKNDNLLIFYAGHGHWDAQVEQGYWWPIDAIPDNPSNWLSNSDLREQIRGINSAHTLLISDACFSGGIFKTRGAGDIRKANRDIQLLYRMRSRRAITSGTLSTVPDKSVFFKYLVKYLTENDQKFISSSDLFTTIRTSVLNNSLSVPQDGVILNTGDEGGDFIFIKK